MALRTDGQAVAAGEGSDKAPLEREELRDVIELALWAGQLLLQYGAETARVEETVHRLGTGLGCDWMDILVSPNALVVTTISGEEFRTRVRRVVHFGVDMTRLSAVNRLSRRVSAGELDRFGVRSELVRISELKPHYNRWLVTAMVGLACAAFSRLFGGDWPVFGVTFVASAAATVVQGELARRHFNQLLSAVAVAFIAALIAGLATRLELGERPQLALAASVLLLVPGVHLINAAEDLLKGHLVTGAIRGLSGGLVSLAIALGLLVAISLLGISGL
jgi:uncharacterized membrane protein YjjP (DUF1212 family)